MKVLRTTLLLAIIIVISSCKSQEQALKDFYRNTNNQMKRESFLIKSGSTGASASQNGERVINSSAESAYREQIKAKSEQYKVNYDVSEYANEDIYIEAAKHRQALIEKASKGCPECKKATSKTTSAANQATTNTATSSVANSSPDFFAHLLDPDKKLIRTEGVSYTDINDKAKLKKYNVIIAALSKYEGTERLKKAFAGSGETLTILKNDSGLFYVIIGSYDTEGQATDKIKRIEAEYNGRYTAAQLQSKYGITFTNLWVLRK